MSDQPMSKHLVRDPDPRGVDEVWARLEVARGRSLKTKKVRAWAIACAVVVCAAMLLLFYQRSRHIPRADVAAIHLRSGERLAGAMAAEGHAPREIELDDGSRIVLAPSASIVPTLNTDREFAVVVPVGGPVVFDIKPNGPRRWSIDAGLASVVVLGTRFTVDHGADKVRVAVERGTVLVTKATGEGRRLGAGESIEIDAVPRVEAASLDAAASSVAEAGAPKPEDRAPARPAAVAAPAAAPPWRPLANRGEYAAAYEALGQENVASESKRAATADDLLQIADVARLSGHSRDSVAPLDRFVSQYSSDKRASTAAFTLGKVHLDELGDARAAAAAFEKAIALGLPAALREDAFARRVEAYAKAGESARAVSAKASYDDAFPSGRYRERLEALLP